MTNISLSLSLSLFAAFVRLFPWRQLMRMEMKTAERNAPYATTATAADAMSATTACTATATATAATVVTTASTATSTEECATTTGAIATVVSSTNYNAYYGWCRHPVIGAAPLGNGSVAADNNRLPLWHWTNGKLAETGLSGSRDDLILRHIYDLFSSYEKLEKDREEILRQNLRSQIRCLKLRNKLTSEKLWKILQISTPHYLIYEMAYVGISCTRNIRQTLTVFLNQDNYFDTVRSPNYLTFEISYVSCTKNITTNINSVYKSGPRDNLTLLDHVRNVLSLKYQVQLLLVKQPIFIRSLVFIYAFI